MPRAASRRAVVEAVPGTPDRVDASAYALRDGAIVLPRTPGFGLELTEP